MFLVGPGLDGGGLSTSTPVVDPWPVDVVIVAVLGVDSFDVLLGEMMRFPDMSSLFSSWTSFQKTQRFRVWKNSGA